MILPLQLDRLVLPANLPPAPALVQPLLDAVREGADTQAVIQQTARHFGCVHFHYALVLYPYKHATEVMTEFLYTTMQPPLWAARWEECDYAEVDPRLSHLQNVAVRNLPMIWSHDALYGTSPKLDAFLDDALSFGTGGCVSFALPDSRANAVIGSWSFSEPNPTPAKMAMLRRYIGDMALWTLYFHDVVIQPTVEAALGAYLAQRKRLAESGTGLAQAGVTEQFARLTPRQRECLALLAEGLEVKQIADRMALTTRRVGNHLMAIREKLQARTTAEAVAKAIRKGVIK